MGIKGLQRLLTVTQSTFPYVKYRTKIMAIDVNILIYKFSYIYHNSIPLFLECFVLKICSFLKFGIFPVFVFDGEAPIEKKHTIKKRYMKKKKCREKLENMKLISNKTPCILNYIQRLERQCFVMTKWHKTSLMNLLDLLHLPYFVAQGEAEVLCALLQKAEQVHYTLSEDTDTFVYGCSRIVRMDRNSERYLIETDLDQFLESKQLNKDEFLNACVLSGCDYIDKSCNLQIETCIEYVKRFHTLEKTVMELKKTRYMHTIEKYRHIKDMYTFKTPCTQKMTVQQEIEGNKIAHALDAFTEFSDNDTELLTTFLTTNEIQTASIRYLTQYVTNCIGEFLLIRHNFFSHYVRK
jgi:5'-3' exonuclease